MIGNHSLECSGGVLQARYNNSQSGKFDGIHLFGPSGGKAYTASVMDILREAGLVKTEPPKYYDELDHKNCEQARYQASQARRIAAQHISGSSHNFYRKTTNNIRAFKNTNTKQGKETEANIRAYGNYQYEVPTFNRFSKLGDFFPENY